MNQVDTYKNSYHGKVKLVLNAESNPFGSQTYPEGTNHEFFAKLMGEDVAFSRFVGFLCARETTYISFPKVFNQHLPSPEVQPDLQWLRRARLVKNTLITYSKHKEKQCSVNLYAAYVPNRSNLKEKKSISHLALAQKILDDFLQMGLWRDREHTYRLDIMGLVDWPRTIAHGEELWVNGGRDPIYPTLSVKRQQQIDKHPLSIAQLKVLHDLRAIYGQILYEGELLLPPLARVYLSHQSLPAIGHQLRRSLRGLNEQRARRLADLLINYIELEDHSCDNQLDIYGTTSFEVIFEHMCAEVFGAQPELLSKRDLGEVQWNLNEKLTEQIGKTSRIGRAQRPDLLIRSELEKSNEARDYVLYTLCAPEGDHLLILDAKYYDIIGALRYTNERANYLPGLEDVRKQYAYAQWIETQLKASTLSNDFKPKKIVNGLLFPTFGLDQCLNLDKNAPPFEQLGYVRIGKAEKIKVLGINIDWLMQAYSQGKRYKRVRI